MSQHDLFLPASSAYLSPCERYRYELTRCWANGPIACWVMLNPSTADADVDDPTIRRCIEFSKRWGCGALVVVNLYAWRATNPRDLQRADDPIGPHNDRHIDVATRSADTVVCAWGASANPERAAEVLRLISRPMCLGTTQGGAPRHPLYVHRDTPLVQLEVS